jgi:hypothetical protein
MNGETIPHSLDIDLFSRHRYDPDHEFLERIARSDMPREANFSGLNGGDWAVLCLVGPGGKLDAALRRSGADDKLTSALEAEYDSDALILHDTEFVLAYLSREGEAKLLRHPHGFAFVATEKALCALPDKPVIKIPVGK